MEDKQPATGDLTEGAAQSEDDPAESEIETAQSEIESAGVSEEAGTAPSKRVGWLARNKAVVAVGVSAALLVGAGAFAAAAVQPYLADRAMVQTKLDIARTAANAITTLWTYTPDDMDRLPDRSAKYLSGAFEDQYRKYVDAIQPTNKQAKVTNSTQVVGAAVESLRGQEATAIVFTNTTSTTPLSKNIPSIKYLSYRLELKQDRGNWLVTKMTTITSLDLTPKL
ncbi:MAG: Mce protein [Mycobacterium sp.]